jgi:Asp-tRNA(Asn)/Glu-tRNA(Gln) amidotransferase A subunit family amidase
MATDADPRAEDFKQVRAVIDQALRDLADCGAQVIGEVSIPSLNDLLQRSMGSFEREAAVDKYLADLPSAPVRSLREVILSPQVLPNRRANLLGALGGTTDDPGYLQQLLARSELRQSVLKVMADGGLDALVYATFDHQPALIPDDVLTSPAPATQPGNNRILSPMVGFPALSVPAGFTPSGLPVGIEFLGRPWSEGLLLRLGYAHERATQRRRPPFATPALAGEL